MNRTTLIIGSVLLVVLMSLVGCLPTYVGNPETATVDPNLVGMWHQTDGDEEEIWVLHKMTGKVYLVQSYRLAKQGDEYAIKSTLASRAWLAEIGGAKFISLELYTPEMVLEKPEPARYVVAKIELEKDQLTVRGIDSKQVTDKGINQPEALESLIKENLKNDDFYVEAKQYKRISADNREQFATMIQALK